MTETERAMSWLQGDDTGVSAKALCAHMTGCAKRIGLHDVPHDGSDLGRCLRLLLLMPDWIPRITEMAVHGERWSVLSAHWTELSGLLMSETGPAFDRHRPAPKTTVRIRELLAPIDHADPGVIRLNDAATIRIG